MWKWECNESWNRYGDGKKNGTSVLLNGLIQQPKLFNKYYISFFGINILSVNMWGKTLSKIFIKCSQYTANRYHYRGRPCL